MPLLLVIGLLAVGSGLYFSGALQSNQVAGETPSISMPDFSGLFNSSPAPSASTGNPLGLPDVDPLSQGGDFSTAYDAAFLAASERWGIPFAWLKAQAIRESSLNASAKTSEPASKSTPPGTYSYGLMQIHWWQGSNRLAVFGYPDDLLGDGSHLFDPYVNADIGAQFLLQNFKQYGTVRDAINAYNTGKAESVREAAGNYVANVVNYYSTISNQVVA